MSDLYQNHVHDNEGDNKSAKISMSKIWISLTLSLILPQVIITFIFYIYYFLTSSVKMSLGLSLVFNILSTSIIPSIILIGVFGAALFEKNENNYSMKKSSIFLFYPAMMLIAVVVGIIFTEFFTVLNSLFGVKIPQDPMSSMKISGMSEGLFFIIIVGVITPIFEEILFRGILLKAMRNHGDLLAIILNGITFGIFHGNFYQMPYTAALGIMLALVTVRSGSIIPAICFHMINNLTASFAQYSGMIGDNPTGAFESGIKALANISNIMITIIIILGVLCIALLLKRKDYYAKSKSITVEYFLSLPFSLIYLGFVVFVFIRSF